MSINKESFLIYKSFYPPIQMLSDEQLGRLFRAIFEYQINDVECVDNDILMAWQFFKNQFRLDGLKYEKKVIANKSNGSKGGRPKTETNPKNPVGFQEPKKADNEKDNDNVNGKVKENDIEKRKLKFADTLKPFLGTYDKTMLNDFYKYWTEPNKSNTKFKQELEKTWSLERRLEVWASRDKNFTKEKPKETSLAHSREFK